MAKREITIFDLLPPEAFIQIDELGYNFLAENGYNTEGCMDSDEKRKALKAELKARGEELRYSGAFDKDTKAILVWFELYKKNEKVATSQGLKFLPKPSEGGESGESEKNRENQDRPSEAPEDNAKYRGSLASQRTAREKASVSWGTPKQRERGGICKNPPQPQGSASR